jgi:probable F420-dependent oxidoreductase
VRIGAVFPQTEIGGHPEEVRAYAQAVEAAGYDHILIYDHVLGADPTVHPGWAGPYDVRTTFHEPLVVFGYMAAVCSLELVTGILIVPQRQTALVAKQAAEVDLLTQGRFRLGVGVGWNAVEYEALGQDFRGRGRRLEEQIELLRQLWSQSTVSFSGQHHKVTGAGLAPLPVQRPIPIWMGGSSPAAYRRMGRLSDGWFPQVRPGPDLEAARDMVRLGARDSGREPDALGMEGRISVSAGDLEAAERRAARWADQGATHVSVNTMGGGFGDVAGHIAALEAVASVLGLSKGQGGE